MKHLRFLSLLCACLMFVAFSSCERDTLKDLPVYEAKELSGKDYLLNYFTPKVMFHYAYRDLESETYSGWLIDNKGTLYTYKSDEVQDFPDYHQLSDLHFNRLLAASEPVGEIDVETLVEKYKKIYKASHGQIETAEANESSHFQAAYYAYFFSSSTSSSSGYSGSNGCGGGSVGSAPNSQTMYNQVKLARAGKENTRLNTNQASDLIDWMINVQLGI